MDGDWIECDGICGKRFHLSCVKRSLRNNGKENRSYSCADCGDIKACHVLKAITLMNLRMDALDNVVRPIPASISLMHDKLKDFSDRWNILPDVSDDLGTLSAKLDSLSATLTDVVTSTKNAAEYSFKALRKVDSIAEMVADIGSLSDVSLPSTALDNITGTLSELRSLITGHSTALASNTSKIIKAITPLRETGTGTKKTAAGLPESLQVPRTRATCQSSSRTPTLLAPAPQIPSTSKGSPSPSVPVLDKLPGPSQPLKKSQALTSASNGTLSPDVSKTCLTGSARSGNVDANLPKPLPTTPASTTAINLEIVKPPASLFISRLSYSTSSDHVLKFITSKLGRPIKNISCNKLTKPNLPDRRTASFRIFVPDDVFPTINSRDFWPDGVLFHPFTSRTPHQQGKNFQSRGSSLKST